MLGAAAVRCWADGPIKAGPVRDLAADMTALRRSIVDSPVRVALHRAQVFTKVFQENEERPWIVRKGMAIREYFQTVPLYLREHDLLAGAISEAPGAMPVIVELGIGENNIYTSERPDRKGYLQGQVPEEIRDWWKNRNMWGLYRAEILGQKPYTPRRRRPARTGLQVHFQSGAPQPKLR